MNKEVSIEPIVGLLFRKWLTEYTVFLVKQSIYRETSYLSFGFLMWSLG